MSDRRPVPRQIALGASYAAYLLWVVAGAVYVASLGGLARGSLVLALLGPVCVLGAGVLTVVTRQAGGHSLALVDEDPETAHSRPHMVSLPMAGDEWDRTRIPRRRMLGEAAGQK
jgi:hypothetical protein